MLAVAVRTSRGPRRRAGPTGSGEDRRVEADAAIAAFGLDRRPVGHREHERQIQGGCPAGPVAMPRQHLRDAAQRRSLRERAGAPVVALEHEYGAPKHRLTPDPMDHPSVDPGIEPTTTTQESQHEQQKVSHANLRSTK